MQKRLRALFSSLAVALAVFIIPAQASAAVYWQCVPFARMISGIQIFGDAHTWWGKAQGKYETGRDPQIGAVMVFKPKGSMRLGHVAVISKMVSDRVVQVAHANWSVIGGGRGQIENDVTVIDVSANNDWSEVKVWFDPVKDIGTSTYPTYGFIYQNDSAKQIAAANSALAQASGAALGVIQAVAGQALAAVNPVQAPARALSEGADRIGSLISSLMSPGAPGADVEAPK